MDEIGFLITIIISAISPPLLIFLIENGRQKRKNKELLRKLERIIEEREDDRKWKL